MDSNLSQMKLTELKRLRSKIDAEFKRRDDSARREVLRKFKKIAAEHGVAMNDVLSEAKPAASARKSTRKVSPIKGRKVPPKYRNPSDSSETWTGRGRKPRWVEEWLTAGKSIDELLIK